MHSKGKRRFELRSGKGEGRTARIGVRIKITSIAAMVLILMLSAVCFINTAFASEPVLTDSNGDGVYEISDADDLKAFAELVNGGDKDANAVLTADIRLNGENQVVRDGKLAGNGLGLEVWTPIGNSSNRYGGVFDGCGYTVYGIVVNDAAMNYAGLFGYISSGVVKNVAVDDSYISGKQYVGGISGRVANGDIRDCMSSAVVISASDTSNAGGIVGYANGKSRVNDCFNVGDVTGINNVGGIVGNSYTAFPIIKNCYNMGNVKGKSYVGAIVGNNAGAVNECHYLSGCANTVGDGNEYTLQYGIGAQSSNVPDDNGLTIKDFNGGNVAYLLQKVIDIDENGNETRIWGQDLENNSSLPGLSSKLVCKKDNCGSSEYVNSEAYTKHTALSNGVCTSCGELEMPKAITNDNYTENNLTKDHVGSYAISNMGQLYRFAGMMEYNGVYDLSAVLTSDITINSKLDENDPSDAIEWIPIAKSDAEEGYTGSFNGQEHKISGVYISSENEYAGLFGVVGAEGIVKNVAVTDSIVNGKNYIGSIAGLNTGKIEWCSSEARIYNDENNEKGYIGGIVGQNNSSVEGCYFNGSIYEHDERVNQIGGIVGLSDEGSRVEKCYNLGSIYLSSTRVSHCGGIVGEGRGSVSFCFNKGNILGVGNGCNIGIGGVVGIVRAGCSVSSCWNEGDVTAESGYSGGITGSLENGSVENCYNAGGVTSNLYAAGIATPGESFDKVSVANCYNIGKITCDNNSFEIVDTEKSITVTNCYFISDGEETSSDKVTSLSAEKFKDGTLLQLLDKNVWTSGDDGYPIIKLEKILVADIELTCDKTNIKKGEQTTILVIFSPEIATDKDVTWTTDNDEVAIVENGIVTAIGGGVANIRAVSRDGAKSDYITITVHEHSYRYSAEGSVITATCENNVGVCDEKYKSATLLEPYSVVYDGTPKEVVVVESEGSIDAGVRYSTKEGATLNAAPVSAGDYVAYIKIGEAEAKIEFTIEKREINDISKLNDIPSPLPQNIPTTSISEENWSGSIVWNCTTSYFDWNYTYTAIVTIITDENYKFSKEIVCEGWQIVINNDGSLTATRSFDPTDARKIVEISALPSDKQLESHKSTASDVITVLDQSIGAVLESNGYDELMLVWSCDEYNNSPNAENIFLWKIADYVLEMYDTSGITLSGSISVTNPSPISVKVKPIDNVKISFNVGSCDVSTLFEIDENAGEAHYSIYEGGNGEGMLDGTTLVFKSAGTIKIKLVTDPSGFYGGGSAIAFLEVTQGYPQYITPEVLSAVYGQSLADVVLPIDENGKWSWDEDPSTPVGEVGLRSYKAVFTPNDKTNYQPISATLNVYVNKRIISLPVIADKKYNGKLQKADIADNIFYTVECNDGGVEAGSYDVVLVLRDGYNLEWENGVGVRVTLKFHIVKNFNDWMETPFIEGWTYGEKPNSPSAKAIFGAVRIEYRPYGSDEAYTSKMPTGAGVYEARFSVEATENYSSLSRSVQFTIAKVRLSVSALNASKAYGEKDPELTWKLTSGTLIGADTLDITVFREVGENVASYTIKAGHGESGNPNYHIVFTDAVFTIEKALPKYTVPTGLTARYGDTLADVPLPAGFRWQKSLDSYVGNAGNNVFYADYTPIDIHNFKIVTDIAISICVVKGENNIITDLSDRKAVCGETLAARYVSAKGTITFESSNPDIASVDTKDGKITVHKAGEVVIRINASGDANHPASVVSYKLIAEHDYSDDLMSDAEYHWNECVCGDQGSKEAHEHSKADCVNDGVCKKCKRVLEKRKEHSYSEEWNSDKDGHWKECIFCSSKCVKEEHESNDADCVSDGICRICNEVLETKKGHNYSEKWERDENGHWHECENCGTKGAVEKHIADGEATHYKDQKCKDCGIVIAEALGHSFYKEMSFNASEHWLECSCGEKKDTGAHSFEDIVTDMAKISDATCEKSALYYRSCSVCGYVGSSVFESSNALGHSFVEYKSNNDATCTVDGTKTAKCERCDATDTKKDGDSKLGHSFVEYKSNNDATCTIDGSKTSKCERCNVTDTKMDEGSKLGHSFVEYKSNNDATCTVDGTKTAKCERCDATDTKKDEGSKLGHSFVEYKSNNDATCTVEGTKTSKCERCNVTDTKMDEGSKLGHSFVEYKSNNDATCTVDGSKTSKCERCNVTDTKMDEGSKLGHSFAEYKSNNDATCNSDGTKTAKCERCDVTDTKTNEGSTMGHNYVGGKCTRCGAHDEVHTSDTTNRVTDAPATSHLPECSGSSSSVSSSGDTDISSDTITGIPSGDDSSRLISVVTIVSVIALGVAACAFVFGKRR